MTPGLRVVDDPEELAALFGRHRACHLYGLADLAEPYWSPSTWWRRGDAAVGIVPLPGSEEVALYAISPAAPDATIELLAEVASEAPAGAAGGGPVGSVGALRAVRPVDDLGTLRKMVVTADDLVRVHPPSDVRIERLGPEHLDDLRALHASDPGAAFVVRSMVTDGIHVGIRDADGTLLASGGTHVLDRDRGVAAIGAVLTHPEHRGRGLAGALVSRLAAVLLAEGLTVGLNVREANVAGRAVYDRLGFRAVHRYEEVRLR